MATKKKPITDMFGTKLEIGDYVAYASTHMHTGMEVLRITALDDPERIQAMCVERSYNYAPNERVAYYKRIPYQGVKLSNYKEK